MVDYYSNSSIVFLIVAALICCYAPLSLSSSSFSDDNPIRQVLPSSDHALSIIDDDHHIQDHHDDDDGDAPPFFSSSIKAIYQFGDSISDTGNRIQENPGSQSAKLPYGQTFFHKPTGRCSDGLLMIDYFTKYLNLPFLDPFLNKNGNFTHGVNFAVAGATALNTSTLAMNGIVSHGNYTNSSLFVQLGWFKSHLNSICATPSECKEKLAKALVVMGEIGGNDYNYAFFQRIPISKIYKIVPQVIQAIKTVVKEIINLGVVNIIVPGNFPIGCMTIYLDIFKTNDSTMYDDLHCLIYLNNHAKLHNNEVQRVIRELQKDHPNVNIVYADYFSAFQDILRHATLLGFDKDTMDKPCCSLCAGKGDFVCKDPYKHVNWDEIHLTQHAYQTMANWLIKYNFHGINSKE